jgi:hypothetical protein
MEYLVEVVSSNSTRVVNFASMNCTTGTYRSGDYIKAEFTSEWMWVAVDYADDKNRLVFGRLDSEPIINPELKLGQEVAISYENIRDHLRFPG